MGGGGDGDEGREREGSAVLSKWGGEIKNGVLGELVRRNAKGEEG